ncbi:MAG: hypothetical protein AB7O96_02155 [Pseudobdellovibrionaceae bacterium]
MNFLKSSLLFGIGAVFVGCASGQVPAEKAQAPQSAPLVQRNFVVRDRSHAEPPLWTYDFMTYSSSLPPQDRFFVGDSGDVNDRIAGCDMAKARARQEIAQEMATFITSKINETAEGQAAINKLEGGGSLERKFNTSLTQDAVALLSGVQVASTMWEERDYSQSGGASSVYNCKALVKINKQSLEDVVKQTTKKALNKITTDDKATIAKSLADAPKEFANQTTSGSL